MAIKKYFQFINEADEFKSVESVDKTETDESASSEFNDLKDDLRKKIEESVKKSSGKYKTYDSFVEDYLRNPKDVRIEGLLNDSDLFEFYQKWLNEIDEILNKIKFFSELPSDNKVNGLYNYITIGTNRAIVEILKMK